MIKIYVENLTEARKLLNDCSDQVIIVNAAGSVKYYGVLVIDYIFSQLQKEFDNIQQIILNVQDDHAALLTAIELNMNYTIEYSGSSLEAKRLLLKFTADS
ncbi:MAG: hypothetical protein AB8B67_03675 [Rickettsiaceae bacterium]